MRRGRIVLASAQVPHGLSSCTCLCGLSTQFGSSHAPVCREPGRLHHLRAHRADRAGGGALRRGLASRFASSHLRRISLAHLGQLRLGRVGAEGGVAVLVAKVLLVQSCRGEG